MFNPLIPSETVHVAPVLTIRTVLLNFYFVSAICTWIRGYNPITQFGHSQFVGWLSLMYWSIFCVSRFFRINHAFTPYPRWVNHRHHAKDTRLLFTIASTRYFPPSATAVCVVFALSRSSTQRHQCTQSVFLQIHPKSIQILWLPSAAIAIQVLRSLQ